MANHQWTQDQLRRVHRLRQKEDPPSWTEIGKEFGIGREAARSAYKRWLAVQGGSIEPQADPDTILDDWRKHVEEEDPITWRQLMNYAETGAEFQRRLRPVRTEASRNIITSEDYIYVAHMADLHLGAPTSEHGLFISTTDYILSRPNLFIVVNGPDLEFALTYFRDASAVLNQVMPPWMQLEAFRLWLKDMLPRTICMCGDNHVTQRLENHLGDIGLAIPDGIPFFQTYGLLTLTLQQNKKQTPVEYKALLAHKYKGSSIYHDLQPVLRMFRDIHPGADWYCTAHTHLPAYLEGVWYPEARKKHPRQRMLVCGTFKTGKDIYALRNFGASGVLGIPTLRLGVKDWSIDYFQSPEAAFA